MDQMREHGSLPRAREDGLLVEVVGEELLLYDRDSNTAHCLSPIAACVWRHCDGARTVTELAGLAGVSEGLVADALYELREKELMDVEPLEGSAPRVSRREAIVRGARVSAAAATGALIVSAVAATPAMAASEEGFRTCEEATPEETCCKCVGGACENGIQTQLLCKHFCEEKSQLLHSYNKRFRCPV